MAKYMAARNTRENTRLNAKSIIPAKRRPPCISPMVPCSERKPAEAEVTRTVAPAMAIPMLWFFAT